MRCACALPEMRGGYECDSGRPSFLDVTAFRLFDWLNTGVEEREALMAVFDMAQRLAVDAFMPHYRQADVKIYDALGLADDAGLEGSRTGSASSSDISCKLPISATSRILL